MGVVFESPRRTGDAKFYAGLFALLLVALGVAVYVIRVTPKEYDEGVGHYEGDAVFSAAPDQDGVYALFTIHFPPDFWDFLANTRHGRRAVIPETELKKRVSAVADADIRENCGIKCCPNGYWLARPIIKSDKSADVVGRCDSKRRLGPPAGEWKI